MKAGGKNDDQYHFGNSIPNAGKKEERGHISITKKCKKEMKVRVEGFCGAFLIHSDSGFKTLRDGMDCE